jgi:hypothetical protein
MPGTPGGSVGFISRRRKRSSIEDLAAAYAQEVATTPDEERELESKYPEAWASGDQKARAFFKRGNQERIAASTPRELFLSADVELTEMPGTPEATAFITSYVRTIESLRQSDEFRASLLRKRADQIDELHQMQHRAPQTWEAAETLADECFEEYGGTLPADIADAALEEWIRRMTTEHVKSLAESHGDMPGEQLKVFGMAFHRRLSERVRGDAPY